MKNNYIVKVYCSLILCTTLSFSLLAQADYEEKGGVVVMEAESLNLAGTNWVVQRDSKFSGFTGSGYIRSAPNNTGFSPGSGTITTKIKINAPGKYIFKWKARVGTGTSTTDANDSWVRFPDASDFYAQKDGSKVYAKGHTGTQRNATGTIPNNKGPGSKGWFKVYSSGAVNKWSWFGRTWDSNSHALFAEFNKAGIFTMEISHRSIGNLIDRIVLSKKAVDINSSEQAKASAPTDANTPENSFTLASSTFDLSKSGISIYPNPATTILNVTGLKNANEKISIIDTYGRVLPASIANGSISRLQVNTAALAAGLYFLKIGDLGQSAFMVR